MTTREDRGSLTQDAVESRPVEGLLLKAPAAAVLCSVSLRTWRAWDAAGRIPLPVRVGRATFWRADELRAWVAAGCPDRETWHAIEE